LTSFASAWAVQRRVIGALLMREIQARWGRRNLGFAWLFCEPLVFALPVLTMWSLMHHGTNSGVPFLAFMWSGYLPLLMFRHITGHCLYAVRSGGALFYHRDITPFDVVVARIGLEVIGNLAATALSFYLFYLLGAIHWPYDPSLFLLGVLYMAWWSVSVALIVAAWSERSEIVEHIWPPISYIYPTFAGLRLSCDQDHAFDCPEQRQFALAASKARSKLPIEGAKVLHCGDLGTPAQTSPIGALCMIRPQLMLVRVVPVAGRSAPGCQRTSVVIPRPRRAGT